MMKIYKYPEVDCPKTDAAFDVIHRLLRKYSVELGVRDYDLTYRYGTIVSAKYQFVNVRRVFTDVFNRQISNYNKHLTLKILMSSTVDFCHRYAIDHPDSTAEMELFKSSMILVVEFYKTYDFDR